MSLTTHLRDSTSPFYQFFASNFPYAPRLARRINADLRAATTLDTPGLTPWEYSLIGTALDYRVRYFFAVTPYHDFVAYHGAAQLGFHDFGQPVIIAKGTQRGYPLNPSVQTFFDSLDVETSRFQPRTSHLSDTDELRLARYCLVLALFEQLSRSGLRRCMNSPLVQAFMAGNLHNADDFLALCPATWVQDMQQLTQRFAIAAGERLSLPAILNPTFFEGNPHVGGGDADLILANTLIDIKTKKYPDTAAYDLYQLLGYVLLDYGNRYRIASVGFYFARQGIWSAWDLDHYLEDLGNVAPRSLPQLRSEFHAITTHLTSS